MDFPFQSLKVKRCTAMHENTCARLRESCLHPHIFLCFCRYLKTHKNISYQLPTTLALVKYCPHREYVSHLQSPKSNQRYVRLSRMRRISNCSFFCLQYTYYGQGGRGDAEAAINITWFCGKGEKCRTYLRLD